MGAGQAAADREKQKRSDDGELRTLELHIRSQEYIEAWGQDLGVTVTGVNAVHHPATPESWNAGATNERIETTFFCQERQLTAVYDGMLRVTMHGHSANTAAEIGAAIARIEEQEERANAQQQARQERTEERRKMLLVGSIVVVVVIAVVVTVTLIYQAATGLPLEYSSGDEPDSRVCQAQSCGEDGNFHWYQENFSTTFAATGEDTFRSTLDSGRFCDMNLHWQIALDGAIWRSGDLPRAGQKIDLDVPLQGVRQVELTASAPPPRHGCFPEISWLARD